MRVRQIVFSGLCAALIAAGAFIRIPLPLVPITLQMPALVLTVLIFGSRISMTSVGLYIAVGLAGIPVFASGGGFGYVMQPTFGYLIGFFVSAAAAGAIVDFAHKGSMGNARKSLALLGLASVVLIIVTYTIGVTYLWLVLNNILDTPTSFMSALAIGVVPTIAKDFVVALVCVPLAYRIKKIFTS